MDEETQKQGVGGLWIGIIVVIVVAGGLFAMLGRDGSEDEVVDDETDITENAVSVESQGAGSVVKVSSVSLLAPGYVVVHVAIDGTPGNVIGHSELLPAGETQNVSIALDEEVAEGSQLFVMLHSDNGDGAYQFPGDDAPLVNESGDIVMKLVDVIAAMEMTDMDHEDGAMMEENGAMEGPAKTVTYSSSGFSPASVSIKVGETVKWMNESGSAMWVASDVHPTHTLYPVSSASDCLGSSFDACRGVASGESWEFTFTEAGSWKYHDHRRANNTGTVVVEE